MKNTIIIQWSEEDNAYIATLPEFQNCKTHGSSEEEALKNAKEVIQLIELDYKSNGTPMQLSGLTKIA